MTFLDNLKSHLYELGLDDVARVELSTFVRSTVAAAAEKVTHSIRRPSQGDYLHLGCGGDRLPGFVNVDRVRTTATDVVADIRRELPFRSASVRGIFHQHAFEHIDRARGGRRLLKESARVLVAGGILRMGIPDLERYAQAYVRFDREFAAAIGLGNTAMAADILNHAFAHGHRFLYDFAAISAELRLAGFQEVRRAEFRDSADPILNRDNGAASRRAETLFVEARR